MRVWMAFSKWFSEIGRRVDELNLVSTGAKGNHWSDMLREKRVEDDLAARMVKGKKISGVSFTSKVSGDNDVSSWFPAKAEGPTLFPGATPIASVTPGSKSSGGWASKAEACKALGTEEWDTEEEE